MHQAMVIENWLINDPYCCKNLCFHELELQQRRIAISAFSAKL